MLTEDRAARAPLVEEEQAPTLEQIERERRHLWTSASLILIAVSLTVVVVSYWTDVFPEVISETLDLGAWRFVFLIVSLGFILYALERERTFRKLTRRLLEESDRATALEAKLHEVRALADVAKLLAGSLERDELIQIVVASGCRLVDADRGVLLVPDEDDRGSLRLETSIGFEGTAPARVPIDEHLVGRVVRTRAAQRASGGLVGEPARSSIATPLVARDELLGVLAVSTRSVELGEYQERMLSLFAEQASLAIANARAYELQRRNAERLAEVDRMRADFVAGITHELKTPLTSLLGYATILRKRAATLSEQQRDEFVGVMERQGHRILSLIEELLQSSRLEAGLGRLQRVPLPLSRIVRDVAAEIATGRDRRIDVDVPEHDLGLFGDPAAIEHVITNLIDNALKYSPHASPVRVAVAEGDGEVLVSVSDEGQGIAPEDLPFIFERFQQAQNARGRASVGLGLYIVQNLVTAHGGRVWADSELGKGTTFTVALPRRRRGGDG